ncbi:hypothetical protein S40285_09205 [Stachybotrys chlorohalonatus IBT 40285]|uniref:Mitochondrial thiamine pyrophosphate carrier 1 n=1 Tax=Stachybotrys chlorohalonatus (strain IBT 40285) TaxID=1283841 RepID=A0A084QPK0_STAC4|nr:hypothetical protein S40285_09205 [Stachybotrys chlorohalonata IBT 40285]
MASIQAARLGSNLADTPRASPVPVIYTTKQNISPSLSLFSGAVAGAVEATITYPFEFAKTRAQLQAEKSKSPLTVLAKIVREDGFRAMYTGCSALVVGTAFKAGVRFLSFDSIRNKLMDDDGKLSPARGILAGMLAGIVESVVAVTPTERIKTALIDDAKSGARNFNGGAQALGYIIQSRGIRDVYRGLISTTLKQSATSAVRMGSYNVLRELSKTYQIPQNTLTTFGSGAVAGIITVYCTQPFDAVKTKSQSARGASTVEAFKSIMAERGIGGFWSGSTMRLGRLILSGGIVFSVYEKMTALLSSSDRP